MELTETFRVGETVRLVLFAVNGDIPDNTVVTAAAQERKRHHGDDDDVTTMTVTENADSWTMEISSLASSELNPGTYDVEAKIEYTDGVVEYTDKTAFRLVKALAR